MQIAGVSNFTSQAFCVVHMSYVHMSSKSLLRLHLSEGSKKEGLNTGLDLLEPLHILLQQHMQRL